MRVLKVIGWLLLNLASFIVPIWVGWEAVKEERAWYAAQPHSPDLHDTPPGLIFGAMFIAWVCVLLIVNLLALAVWWWRRKRSKKAAADGAPAGGKSFRPKESNPFGGGLVG